MNTYILIKDWFNIPKGTLIEPSDGQYVYIHDGNTITFNQDTLNNKEYFNIYQDPLLITEIQDDDSNNIKQNFRMQLDIHCTKDKLKEIESFIRENLNYLVN